MTPFKYDGHTTMPSNEKHLPILVEAGKFQERKYYIIDMRSHPCAYVQCWDVLMTDFYNKDVPVHGGITFVGKLSKFSKNLRLDRRAVFVGWDYAHSGDRFVMTSEDKAQPKEDVDRTYEKEFEEITKSGVKAVDRRKHAICENSENKKEDPYGWYDDRTKFEKVVWGSKFVVAKAIWVILTVILVVCTFVCALMAAIVQSRKQYEYERMLFKSQLWTHAYEVSVDNKSSIIMLYEKDLKEYRYELNRELKTAYNPWVDWHHNDIIADHYKELYRVVDLYTGKIGN